MSQVPLYAPVVVPEVHPSVAGMIPCTASKRTGKNLEGSESLTRKSRPEFGRACLRYAEFARQLLGEACVQRIPVDSRRVFSMNLNPNGQHHAFISSKH